MKTIFAANLNTKSKKQRLLIAVIAVIIVAFNIFVCAVSIDGDWLLSYPLPGSVDDYGCYPQVFDAFIKGRTDIDTEYDLSKYESLDNPYDTAARRAATGEKFGVTWDRAYYNGKLYSYFGVAPVILLYFPAYFITGSVLSDALAAALISSAASVTLVLLLIELLSRLKTRPPLWLVCLGALCLPFGALLYPTLTNANFYHIAVLFGIFTVAAAFLFLLYGEKGRGAKRICWFALSGFFSAGILAARPNLVFYLIAAVPVIVRILKLHYGGTKGVLRGAFSFAVPAVAVGVCVMLYNAARFGSPFDFGSNYQLTLWDMSGQPFSFAFVLPALYHYFLHLPVINGSFPFVHPGSGRLSGYAAGRRVYVSGSIGVLFLPCTWGMFALPFALKGSGKTAKSSAALAAAAVFVISVFDMCYAGVHLRYAADIAFACALGGIFGFVALAARFRASGGKTAYRAVCAVAIIFFAVTVLFSTALCFDNERDMILRCHREFYDFIKGLFGQ